MGVEIERKFLLANDDWRTLATRSQRMSQGYLPIAMAPDGRCSVRVRIAGENAWLNIKSATPGISRDEYEYPIPSADAERMLRDFCGELIEKTRHYVKYAGATYEVDEFFGDNVGLIVAELELHAADQVFDMPAWLGREVSDEPRYYNARLARHPYKNWNEHERD